MSHDSSERGVGCVVALIMLPFTVLFRAFVLTRLWIWFMVPLGVPSIGLAHAYGIAILVAMMTHQVDAVKSNNDEDDPFHAVKVQLIFGVIMPLIIWISGWICYCLM